MVVLVPVPVIAPGLIVQVPVAGSPVSTTLPVVAAHEAGWVIVPTTGAVRSCRGIIYNNVCRCIGYTSGITVNGKVISSGARLSIVVVVP